jgi:hypothetical protein
MRKLPSELARSSRGSETSMDEGVGMTTEELKKQSDNDEIRFLDRLSIFQQVLDRMNEAELELQLARIEYDDARLAYQEASLVYSRDLSPFLTSRRAYIAARNKES